MTSKTITVNGAVMDRAFFEDNLTEARSIKWEVDTTGHRSDHHHCIVCTAPVIAESSVPVFRSGGRYLCSYCYEHFVKSQ